MASKAKSVSKPTKQKKQTAPSTPPPNPSKVFLVEQRKNNELCLENIDAELRMEQVRQLGSKLEWSAFGQIVRRNLLDKRNTLDTDSRIDCLKGIAFMRENMPIDSTASSQEKFRIMAESLGCSQNPTSRGWVIQSDTIFMDFTLKEEEVEAVLVGFNDAPQYFSKEGTRMLQKGQWTEFRNIVRSVTSFYAKDISSEDLVLCKRAWRMMEYVLAQYAMDPYFPSVNRYNYGFYLSPGDLQLGRIYYLVEPLYSSFCAKRGKYHLENLDHDLLPYFEFSFIKHTGRGTALLPSEEGVWDEKTPADVAICLKLSKPVLISRQTKLKLGEISAKTVAIRHYTNVYRFLMGEMEHEITKDVKMITQFPEGQGHQQLYNIERKFLLGVDDSVITEIYLRQLEDFHKVIYLLRNERMHQSLWESMMAMCYEKQGIQEHFVKAIPMNVTLSRAAFIFSFNSIYGPIKVYIREGSALDAKVEVFHGFPEVRVAERIDGILSRKLNETWSIPNTLKLLVHDADCVLSKVKVPLRQENKETAQTAKKLIYTRK